VSGDFICGATGYVTVDFMIVSRRIKFLKGLQTYHCGHIVLHNLFLHVGRHELYLLNAMHNA